MTHHVDVARGRDIVARWCNLAEQRLEHLTELFETGRWRRYHSERAFLENIQEAKAAVETWRSLLNREAALDNSAIDLSWRSRARSTLPRGDRLREPVQQHPPRPVPIPEHDPEKWIPVFRKDHAQNNKMTDEHDSTQLKHALGEPPRNSPADVRVALESRLVVANEAPSAPVAPVLDELPLPVLDLNTVQARYPSLRNAL